jgi:uncharacterized protein involved in type VI secretion and phage assembly
VNAIVPAIRAIIREELAARRMIELGVVTQVFSNADGSTDGRLEVHVRLRGSAVELQRVPVAVGRRGLAVVPRVDDLVVIGFVGGDLNAPVVLGSVYDEQVAPPTGDPDEIVYAVPDDAADGKRRFELKLPNDRTITVEDAKLTITMGSTVVTVEADGAISLESGGDMTLKSSGALKLEASGDVTIKGASVTAEASGAAKLKGATTTIAGTTDFSPT